MPVNFWYLALIQPWVDSPLGARTFGYYQRGWYRHSLRLNAYCIKGRKPGDELEQVYQNPEAGFAY